MFKADNIPFNSDTQFIVSIQEPIQYGYTDSHIEEILTNKLKDVVYAVWNLYQLKDGTNITDIYVFCPLGKSINKIKSSFPNSVIKQGLKNHIDNITMIKCPTVKGTFNRIENVKIQEYGKQEDIFNITKAKEAERKQAEEQANELKKQSNYSPFDYPNGYVGKCHYTLTINNPDEPLYTDEGIREKLVYMGAKYATWATEQATTGTIHKHIYVYMGNTKGYSNETYFVKLKEAFPKAHIEWCKGSTVQNIKYVQKDGNSINEYGMKPFDYTEYRKGNTYEMLNTVLSKITEMEQVILSIHYEQKKNSNNP